MHEAQIPKILIKAKREGWNHVFFLMNHVTTIISRMIIDAYGIDEEKCITVSFRDTNTTMINSLSIEPERHWYDRFLIRLFNDDPLSRRILRNNNLKSQKFILYTSWAYKRSVSAPSVNNILRSNLCKGHIYIEEGQASYQSKTPYSTYGHIRDRSLHVEDLEDIYREDAHAYIGILPDAFPPPIPRSKRYILENHLGLKKYYEPFLLGVKTIGLTCAIRRLTPDQWEQMLGILIESMSEGGVIKLHPSFTTDTYTRRKIESIFKNIAPESIQLCRDDVILEIEMLYEPKTLIGSLTSLSRYADAFGSKFIDVELY